MSTLHKSKAISFFLLLLPIAFGFGCMTTLTPLMTAAQAGQATTVQALLDAGADINEKDGIGWTALMFAARNGYPTTVQVLIDSGARINVKDEDGNTPLMAASGYGDIATVKTLINAGANVNAENNNGQTALIWAVTTISVCNSNIIKILLDAGANHSNIALRLVEERKNIVKKILDCDYMGTERILKDYNTLKPIVKN
jgi:ankyrin repeat protein